MADDFADKFSSPVVHVKWWGSYLNDFIIPNFPVNKFLISFESDVPASAANPFSRPGEPLLNQIVRRVPVGGLTPGSGTFTEVPISGGGPPLGETLYEYNAELHLGKEFFQKPDTVYWLKIVALVDLPPGIPVDPDQPPTFCLAMGMAQPRLHDPRSAGLDGAGGCTRRAYRWLFGASARRNSCVAFPGRCRDGATRRQPSSYTDGPDHADRGARPASNPRIT